MIGKLYAYILKSKYGGKFFRFDASTTPVKWTRKGMERFLFWNCLVYFTVFLGSLAVALSFSPRMIISAIILSLYLKEKGAPIFAELLNDLDKVEMEDDKTKLTETNKYKILRDILNGDNAYESITRYD